jgi:hypothetical protein
MKQPAAVEVAREFWRLMGTNDFPSVAAVLAQDFLLEWPQTKERIRGAERFARMNQEYPAHGPWRFTINRLVGGESELVRGRSRLPEWPLVAGAAIGRRRSISARPEWPLLTGRAGRSLLAGQVAGSFIRGHRR